MISVEIKTKELAGFLGISPQMCNRLKKRGMPCDSLQSAIEWRKRSLDLTQTKSWRIDGNQGVKPVSPETAEDTRTGDEQKVFTHTMPDLWFSQVQHLNTALREHGFDLPAETLLKVQTLLFLLYQIEADRFFGAELVYSIPPVLWIGPDNENYPLMIASLEHALND